MPEAWQRFSEANIYTAILLAATVEGLGLPIPAEALYVVAGVLVHEGKAALVLVILAGVAGNVLGSLTGYTLAYLGGAPLLRRLTGVLRIKPAAFQRMEQFFHRYGAATVFLSRFLGFIRAATIYSAGLARMRPWSFSGYLRWPPPSCGMPAGRGSPLPWAAGCLTCCTGAWRGLPGDSWWRWLWGRL